MSASTLIVVSLFLFILGYKYYSKFIEKKVYNLKYNEKTPAHMLRDDVDYMPTKKHILFGHHFTSIAGAAPIVGPCIAAYWGWLPALLWVVLGTIFIGAVHDFGALAISLKEKGRSIADVASSIVGEKATIMFLLFVMMLTWLVLAVFSMVISGLFVNQPSSVLPINIEILIALIIGYLIYKKNKSTTVLSIIALIFLYLFIYLGTLYPISFETFGFSKAYSIKIWIILLFIYSGIASLLPVWTLLQPRDYINSHQLIVGLALIFIAIGITNPSIDAEMIRTSSDHSAPPMFPFLFVTIACGAVSGFHGLVSSGTTSKQVNKMEDARLIGYGGMLGEGTLALAATICAVAGISLVGSCNLPSQGFVENLNWGTYYESWTHATQNKAAAFVLGGGAFIQQLGVESTIATTIVAVLIISFAATTLDSATRIQRLIISEIGSRTKINYLKNRYIATILAIIPAILLCFISITDTSGNSKQMAWILWPIFGASNQMLAALSLLTLTMYFWMKKENIIPLIIPFFIVLTIAFSSLVIKCIDFYKSNNYLLLIIDLIMISMILWMSYEAIKKIIKK